MGRGAYYDAISAPPIGTARMEYSMATQNQDEIGATPLFECDEQRFVAFVNAARFEFGIPAIFAVIVALAFVLPSGISKGTTFEYAFAIGLPLLILPQILIPAYRARFVGLLRGDLETRTMWIYGLAPVAILVALLGLVVQVSCLTHESVRQFTSSLIYHRGYIADLFLAPIGEEIFFRVWLQTRLQQGFGKLDAMLGGAQLRPWFSGAGAALCALLFLASHVNGVAQGGLYVLTAWLTWLRYRHRSLGATLIAHVGWDGALGLFGILVLTHVLK